MRILLNRQPKYNQPWGGGNDLLISFCNYANKLGHEIVHHYDDNIDIIFMFDHRPDNEHMNLWHLCNDDKIKNIPVLFRINECSERGRGPSNLFTVDMKLIETLDKELYYVSNYINSTVFVSNWIKDYHLNKGWACSNTHVIINGVNKKLYKPNKKFNNKINIVTHHWSNSEHKGQSLYEQLDKWCQKNNNFTFTYIGRTKRKLSKIIKPLYGKELADELGKYDIYVSGSKSDPGPNHVLQSLACKLPTYVAHDSGGAREFAGDDHIFSSFKELEYILLSKHFKQNNAIKLQSWEECITKYIEIMESLIENN